MALILLIVAIILIAYKIYSFVTGKPANSPPGIVRLPIWGSYWLLLWGNYKFPHKSISYYVKKYKSKIISLYMGENYTIVANDYASIREILTRREFDGRLNETYILKARAYGEKLGVIFSDDAEWLEQRRFALRNMRDFGFGRRHERLEAVTAHEIGVLINILKKGPRSGIEKTVAKDGLALFPDILYASSANPIWFIMTGEIYAREDYELLRNLARSAMALQRYTDSSGGAISITPWLRHFGHSFGFDKVVAANYRIVDFFKAFLDRRKAHPLIDEDKPDGFLDVYLKKLKECDETTSFSDKQLLIVAVDMLFPAISGTPSMLTHIIKLMMHNPEVLKKVQDEIDTVVGRDRLPEWNDRSKLPYTEATIREALRIETLTPWSVIHRAMEPTTLMGYDVPKNTVIVTNLAYMHKDPDQWGDPENFRPERFLTEDGERLAKDYSLPFGLGRRVCAGETFARFGLFAHFAALAQNFNFDFVEGEPTTLEDVLPGLSTTPKETWIRVIAR